MAAPLNVEECLVAMAQMIRQMDTRDLFQHQHEFLELLCDGKIDQCAEKIREWNAG